MSYFKLGVQGEGFTFFLPDSYKKSVKTLGSGVKRSINGKAKKDVIRNINTFEIGFDYLPDREYLNLYEMFRKNTEEGKDLIFEDDQDSFIVLWGADGFGLDDRKQDDEIFWSGVMILEEI